MQYEFEALIFGLDFIASFRQDESDYSFMNKNNLTMKIYPPLLLSRSLPNQSEEESIKLTLL